MKKRFSISFLVLMGMLGFMGCDDGDANSTPAPAEQSCVPECTDGNTCVEGVCQCGSEICKADEQCKSDKCVPKSEPCTDDDCEPPTPGDPCEGKCSPDETCVDGICKCGDKTCESNEVCKAGVCEPINDECTGEECDKPDPGDPCEGKCREGETCDEGECKCGENICKADESCNSGTCEKEECTGEDCETPTVPCNGACSPEETCVNNTCKCGDNICEDHQICKSGSCVDEDDTTTDDDGDPAKCEPACKDTEKCEDGECVPQKTNECNPECDSSIQYCDNGVCKKIEADTCDSCNAGETCVDGVCKCGKSVCKDDELCSAGTCKPIDPCANKTCKTGETCVDGTCKAMPISLKPNNLDVMLSSVSSKMVATNSDDSDLKWTVDGKSETKELSGLRCKKKDGTASKKMSECIIKDKSKKTETVQFIGHSRHLKTIKVTVENASKAKAEATLTLKPYFDMDNFIQLSSLIYRNGYTPGHHVKNYPGNKESDDEMKANLGGNKTAFGPENPYGKQVFSEEELAVIDNDMYVKYIKPYMLKGDDGSYYGTRASVVAAARFLILQFPYDIPYYMGAMNSTKKALSHYVFTYHDTQKTKISEAAIRGLNLTSNVYNSATDHSDSHILRKGVVPWGAAFNCLPGSSGCSSSINYPFNGLECSGFVTWSLRNGMLSLGDWKTMMFAKSGDCKPDGKVLRNYECPKIVNNNGNKYSWSNINNNLFSANAKLSRLKESDFHQLNNKSESDLQKIFKKAKAGDLLWKGKYTDSSHKTYKNGHIAMIIGIKHDSEGKVTHIYVGEATGSWSGNKLTKYKDMAAFAGGSWVKTSDYASFLIRMDNVYDYYSKKTTKATTEKSDCPDNVNTGGNCYKYKEMYNTKFNSAIVNKSLK